MIIYFQTMTDMLYHFENYLNISTQYYSFVRDFRWNQSVSPYDLEIVKAKVNNINPVYNGQKNMLSKLIFLPFTIQLQSAQNVA